MARYTTLGNIDERIKRNTRNLEASLAHFLIAQVSIELHRLRDVRINGKSILALKISKSGMEGILEFDHRISMTGLVHDRFLRMDELARRLWPYLKSWDLNVGFRIIPTTDGLNCIK